MCTGGHVFGVCGNDIAFLEVGKKIGFNLIPSRPVGGHYLLFVRKYGFVTTRLGCGFNHGLFGRYVPVPHRCHDAASIVPSGDRSHVGIVDPCAVERQMDEVVAVDGGVFAGPTIDLFGIVVVPVDVGHRARKNLLSIVGKQSLVERLGLAGRVGVDKRGGRCDIDRSPCDGDVLFVGLLAWTIDDSGRNCENKFRNCRCRKVDVENTAGAIDHGIVDRTTIEQNSIFGRSCKADVFVKHNCYGVVAGIDLTASGERVARCGQSISLVADDAQKCGCWRIYDSILCVGVHAGCPSEEDSRCTDDGENLDVFHNIHNLYDIIRQ